MSEDRDKPILDVRMGGRRLEPTYLGQIAKLLQQEIMQRGYSIELIGSGPSPGSKDEEVIFGRVSKLEDSVSSIADAVRTIDRRIGQLERSLNVASEMRKEALSKYADFLANVPEVSSAYFFETPDGLDIWTLHDAKNPLKILDKISEIQVYLDKSFPSLYFDFNLLKASEVTPGILARTRPFYERG